jgi:MoaA/NifB/PqqE/SkfB family radical SAM enzyme
MTVNTLKNVLPKKIRGNIRRYLHRPSPRMVVLYLTRRCDLRCPHCQWILRDEDFFENYDMSLTEATKILDEYQKRYSISSVDIAAEGEVLLYKEFENITTHAIKRGLEVSFTTNGTLLDRYSDFLLENLRNISISIDGYDAPTYIEHRGGTEKHYERVIDNVKNLVAKRDRGNYRSTITVNCIIGRFNFDYIQPMIAFAEEVGIDRMRFGNYHPTDGIEEKLAPLVYGDLEVEAKYREIIGKNDYSVNIGLPSLYGGRKTFRCTQLFEGIVVGAKGDFSPCCHNEPDPQHGSFFVDPEEFGGGSLAEFRRQFLKANDLKDLPTICQRCPRLSPERAKFSREEGSWSVPKSPAFSRLMRPGV